MALLLNELAGLFQKDCIVNFISDNLCGLQPFTLFSDVSGFDPDGSFMLTWTASGNADNYTLYQDGEILAEGLTVLNYTINDLPIGSYEFYVRAFNEYEERDSNTIIVIVVFSIIIKVFCILPSTSSMPIH